MSDRLERAYRLDDAVLADLDRQFPGIRFRVIDEQDQMRRLLSTCIASLTEPPAPTT